MIKSYLVKSPVHFADFGFFVKVGDILVHDTSNSNKLIVYRNGAIVKAVKQTSLGLSAMQKSGFIEEQTAKTAPKVEAPQEQQIKQLGQLLKASEKKRGKGVATEVPFEELPQHLKDLVTERDQ